MISPEKLNFEIDNAQIQEIRALLTRIHVFYIDYDRIISKLKENGMSQLSIFLNEYTTVSEENVHQGVLSENGKVHKKLALASTGI